VMGERQAATVVAAILHRGGAIASAGGYLRDLTRKAEVRAVFERADADGADRGAKAREETCVTILRGDHALIVAASRLVAGGARCHAHNACPEDLQRTRLFSLRRSQVDQHWVSDQCVVILWPRSSYR
jgi:hypothetical protein